MLLFAILLLFTPCQPQAQTLPDWFLPLREAIYEQQLSADQIEPLYKNISDRVKTTYSGADRHIMLSRCEYFMGRAYLFEERKTEAGRHFEEGMRLAELALSIQESAEAWQMRAENLSQNCLTRSTSYVMSNGPNVEKFSKNALALNKRNASAQYMIACRWVYAPSPFNNFRRGMDMLNAILTEADVEKDDRFNIYISIAYVHTKQKNISQARSFIQKALEIYPTNKYAKNLLDEL